ncbi:hypothetical protein FACS189427_09420 [Planctomycetales bacterium]|nr:hypothetical protein FACS189427_09420 [Planctomycetales bacterium]
MIAILLLLMLDFQATRTTDIPYSDFRITEIEEPALTGCAMNPSGGMRSDGLLMEPLVSLPDDEPLRWEPPQANISVPNATEIMRIQRMPFPPVAPPEPPQPPVATPEPPTIAILTLTGLALLFILFGRRFYDCLLR